MKRMQSCWLALAASVALAAGAGCQNEETATDIYEREEAARELDVSLALISRGEVERNGIIAQHTLYPHHFVPNSAVLNDLGERDVAVLAEHYASIGKGTFPLNVRRSGASDELYQARVKTVTDELAQGGVGKDNIEIADALPGGEGMDSERVFTIVIKRDRETETYYESGDASESSLTITESSSSSK